MTSTKGRAYAVIYTFPSGREEVMFRRPIADMGLARDVFALRRKGRIKGWSIPYSLRRIDEKTL